MKRASSVITIVLVTLVSAACGAGTPASDAAKDQAQLFLLPVSTASEDAKREIADGVRELDMGRDPEAYEHFQRAIAADSNAAIARAYAAIAAQAASSAQDAYKLTAQAVALAPRASASERLFIDVINRSSRGDFTGARASAMQLVAAEPTNPRPLLVLAVVDSFLADHTASRASLSKAIEIAPNFTPAYVASSISYAQFEPRDLPKSEQLARKAIELEPEESVMYDVLGDALRAQGKLEEAGVAYTKMDELDPVAGGLQQRAHVNTFLGRFPEARADYDAAVAKATGNNKPAFAFYHALVFAYEGAPQSAYDELTTWYAEVDNMKVPAPQEMKHFIAGQQMIIAAHTRKLADLKAAVARVNETGDKLIDQVRTDEFTSVMRAQQTLAAGYVALVEGDYAAATRFANESMATDRSAGAVRLAHELLGHSALAQKRLEDAVREFELSDPNDPYVAYHKALALDGLGRPDEAKKLYNFVATFYFNQTGFALVRADAIARLKKAGA
ncbi:MAG: hypothetical protein ABIV28_04430 [Longimicrobiales bacterium]